MLTEEVVKLTASMVNPKKILLLGDSWSQGELDFDQDGKHYVTHRGVHQYLLDLGHNVINLGGLGKSNSQAVRQYRDNPGPYDLILWFSTDVLRDVNWSYENLFLNRLKSLKSIKSTFDEVQSIWFSNMNDLARERNQKIYVMGGFSAIDSKIDFFPNLINFIPSIINLINPQYNFSMYGYFTNFEWFVNIIETAKKEQWFTNSELLYIKEEFTNMMDENIKLTNFLKTDKKYFWPDGIHPNRYGHQIIFNKIKEELLDV